ncbi:alpha/beta hydrolase [Sphingomonas cannabina]|uniref:alpha/beta hydrolase n=1 Tax=Sphingomonas cannabina TaxID=2899123 RepID=UPI001F19D17E|nr:alpha/beta hydrolase [Sphingomonas cannabina]UIJ47422.1 alpha/beta hydrolase [Sphingomonas cannabina]
MRKWMAAVPALALLIGCANAAASEGERIRLSPAGPAGTIGPAKPETTDGSLFFGTITRNVSEPSLSVFPADPAVANGTGVVIAPGGGFHMLSIDNEGIGVAKWLNGLGITAFVLRYRLVPTGSEFPGSLIKLLGDIDQLKATVAPLKPLDTADGEAAMAYVRANAASYGIKPGRLGMMGFSAGGAVTMWTTLANQPQSRPDFVVAVYPGLVGDSIAVPPKAPPLLAIVAADDKLAGEDAGRVAKAWTDAGADATLVTYPEGGHGFGIAKKGKASDAWTERTQQWLQAKGLLGK